MSPWGFYVSEEGDQNSVKIWLWDLFLQVWQENWESNEERER